MLELMKQRSVPTFLAQAVLNSLVSSQCWEHLGVANLAKIADSSRDHCDLRYDTLSEAQAACASQQGCGGVTRDSGFRCGNAVLYHFELRSARRVKAVSIRGGALASWVLHRHRTYATACMWGSELKQWHQRPDFETPRQRWRRMHPKLPMLPREHDPMLPAVRLVVLVSGTLRGFSLCAPTLWDALLQPSAAIASLSVATYDRNDCGAVAKTVSLEHSPLLPPSVRAAFAFHGVPLRFHLEPAERTAEGNHPLSLYHAYAQKTHQNPQMEPRWGITDSVLKRYHSQFHLRHQACACLPTVHVHAYSYHVHVHAYSYHVHVHAYSYHVHAHLFRLGSTLWSAVKLSTCRRRV